MFDKGFFCGLFDFNNDGKLDGFEQAADHLAFMSMMEQSEKEDVSSFGVDIDEGEITAAGLDYFDLELMDEDERIETLEDAGLDPDDFDF